MHSLPEVTSQSKPPSLRAGFTAPTDLVLHSPPLLEGRRLTLHSGTYGGRSVVVKRAVDAEGSRRLRHEAGFFREVGSRLDGTTQRALSIIEDEDGEVKQIVLEQLSDTDGWAPLRYFSRLSREEAFTDLSSCAPSRGEKLYFHLVTLHTSSGYEHGSFYAENIYHRPSSLDGQPTSFRLANFALAERHDCLGADCGELLNARIHLGLEERFPGDDLEEEQEYEEWELEYFRRHEEAEKRLAENDQRLLGHPLFPPRSAYYREYDGPLDLTKHP
ncbi:hypothetical protein JCM10213_005840 [Rhodosporidiobolus nylandii]